MAERKNLDILPLVAQKDPHDVKGLDDRLLQPPFLLVIQGGVKSGKTLLLTNLVINKNFYRGVFKKNVLISPTALQDTSILPISNSQITETHLAYSDGIIDGLISEADSIPGKAWQKPRVLIIVDDSAGDWGRGSALARLCMRYRHYNFSIIMTAQSFRTVPSVARVNASGYMVFLTVNASEVEKMAEEWPTIPNWIGLYTEATSERYSFLYIDFRRMIVRKRFQDPPLWMKNA